VGCEDPQCVGALSLVIKGLNAVIAGVGTTMEGKDGKQFALMTWKEKDPTNYLI